MTILSGALRGRKEIWPARKAVGEKGREPVGWRRQIRSLGSNSYKGNARNRAIAANSGISSLHNRLNGGERGIRTLDTGVSPYNGLANRRLQPLGHLSGGTDISLSPGFQTEPYNCKLFALRESR